MEHITIRLAEIIRSSACARLQKSRDCPGSRSRCLARHRTPIVRIGGQQTGAPLDALMSFPQFFHGRPTLTDYNVARVNGIICNLVLVQSSQKSALADDKYRAVRMHLTQEIRCV